jgi:hypothetical protein
MNLSKESNFAGSKGIDMKQVLVLIPAFLLLAVLKSVANDSCIVLLNKQVVFKGTVEQPAAVASIKSKSLRSNDRITIVYHTENESRGWRRTFYVQDSTQENMETIELGKQSGSVTISATVLNAMKEKKKPVFIYTISLPKDKTMAARIRVKTLFLCKIEWS